MPLIGGAIPLIDIPIPVGIDIIPTGPGSICIGPAGIPPWPAALGNGSAAAIEGASGPSASGDRTGGYGTVIRAAANIPGYNATPVAIDIGGIVIRVYIPVPVEIIAIVSIRAVPVPGIGGTICTGSPPSTTSPSAPIAAIAKAKPKVEPS